MENKDTDVSKEEVKAAEQVKLTQKELKSLMATFKSKMRLQTEPKDPLAEIVTVLE